jgi:hypothetical protein
VACTGGGGLQKGERRWRASKQRRPTGRWRASRRQRALPKACARCSSRSARRARPWHAWWRDEASRCSSPRIVTAGATATPGPWTLSRASQATPRRQSSPRPEVSTSCPTAVESPWVDAGSAHGELPVSGSAEPRGRRGHGGVAGRGGAGVGAEREKRGGSGRTRGGRGGRARVSSDRLRGWWKEDIGRAAQGRLWRALRRRRSSSSIIPEAKRAGARRSEAAAGRARRGGRGRRTAQARPTKAHARRRTRTGQRRARPKRGAAWQRRCRATRRSTRAGDEGQCICRMEGARARQKVAYVEAACR